jgi:outer membrane protein OmpA-like peptidoglycan-associated protein
MDKRAPLITTFTVSFLLSLPLAAQGQTGRLDSEETVREQAAAVAEERAEVAREEAEIAREAAALEQRKADLAERRARLERKEAQLLKETTARTYQLEQQLAELKTRETERGLVFTIGDVSFETGEAELKAEAMRRLYPLVTYLKEHPNREVIIEGHTDSTGSADFNLQLSQQRADAVRDFLVSNGIDPDRIITRGYGQGYPVASNVTAAGRQENRRVEVVVLRSGERVAERERRR